MKSMPVMETCDDSRSIILNKLKATVWSLPNVSIKGVTKSRKKINACVSPQKTGQMMNFFFFCIILSWKRRDWTVFTWCFLVINCFCIYYFSLLLLLSLLQCPVIGWACVKTLHCCQISCIIGCCCNTTPPLPSPQPRRRINHFQTSPKHCFS